MKENGKTGGGVKDSQQGKIITRRKDGQKKGMT